jgi:hypothetical protein
MLGTVVAVLAAFGFLVWYSYKSGARRYEALLEIQRKERNQLDPS